MSLNTISLAIAWERRVSQGSNYFNPIEGSSFAEYQRLSKPAFTVRVPKIGSIYLFIV
jgi:hypothetical protein